MEGLVRLVTKSFERHGLAVPPARIDWSTWTVLHPALCLTAPCEPGLFVIAERLMPHAVPNNVPQAVSHTAQLDAVLNPSAPLIVLEVGQTNDLGVEMARRCSQSAFSDRVNSGRCLVRFAAIEDADHRASACAALRQQLTPNACSERSEESLSNRTIFASNDFASDNQNDDTVTTVVLTRDLQNDPAEPLLAHSAHQLTRNHAAPLPSGF